MPRCSIGQAAQQAKHRMASDASSCTHRLPEGRHDVTAQIDVLEHALQLGRELASALGLQLACNRKDVHDAGTHTQHRRRAACDLPARHIRSCAGEVAALVMLKCEHVDNI